jgi:hypothetical protein
MLALVSLGVLRMSSTPFANQITRSRHESGYYRLNEDLGYYGELQAETSSGTQRKRGCRDDHSVSASLPLGNCH